MTSKKTRWNPAAVIEAAKRGERRALQRCGVLVKQTAERSIKTTLRKSSAAGGPPNQRPGTARRPKFSKTIRWELDGSGVVIGSAPNAGSRVPSILEHGGPSSYTLRGLLATAGDSERDALRRRFHLRGLSKSVYVKQLKQRRPRIYEARPYMLPALKKLLNQLPKQFKG